MSSSKNSNQESGIRNQEYLNHLRHSASHLLAAAVLELWPDAKRTIGPAIENGFYYDFEFSSPISENNLPKIEQKMKEIVKTWKGFERKEVTAEEAKEYFKDNPYKLELIEDLLEGTAKVNVILNEAQRSEESTPQAAKQRFAGSFAHAQDDKRGDQDDTLITFYTSGNFTDLCRGGHVESPSKELKHFKLLSIAGAYWRGNEKNKMLTRIYGTAFPTKEELEKYLWQLEEAKKRDHRKLGKELKLFTFSDDVGPGLPLWTPKGTIIRDSLEDWAKEIERKWGYVRVSTPHIAKHTLFEISGHLPYYKDDMYAPMDIDGEAYYLKGMNCPHHHQIYLSDSHSYRELPLRFAEYGMCYRYEASGTLFGLMRVRALCQNDSHIYCTMEQAEGEFLTVLKLHEYYYQTLGLRKEDYYIVVGLPDPAKKDKYHGEKELWDTAERMMRSAIEKSGIRSKDDIGGAAFYGPKIDFNIRSSIGREFSISTNQLDLFMPRRFKLQYIDSGGKDQYCAVIHRAPLGSHERFIGFLIEHFAGAFPVWLSPVQAIVVPIGEAQKEYAEKVRLAIQEVMPSARISVDESNETLQKKIRNAQLEKIPYMLVVGGKEMEKQAVNIRLRSGETVGEMSIEDFIVRLREKVEKKALDL